MLMLMMTMRMFAEIYRRHDVFAECRTTDSGGGGGDDDDDDG